MMHKKSELQKKHCNKENMTLNDKIINDNDGINDTILQ